LGDYNAALDTLTRRQAALDSSRRSFGHAQARFAAGDIMRIELLAAQRLLHEAETVNLRAQTAAAVQLVALYKAIGGGWGASEATSSTPIS
jgi:outer membrane protein TolC